MSTATTMSKSKRDLLKGAAVPKAEKKKGSDIPEFHDPQYADAVNAWLNAKRTMDDAEAEKKMIEADLIPYAEGLRRTASKQAGESLSSIRLNGTLYTTQARYKEITDAELVARLEAGVPEGTYFLETYKIEVDVEKLPEELLEALIAAGIKPVIAYKPTGTFHDARTMVLGDNPEAQALKPVAYFKA